MSESLLSAVLGWIQWIYSCLWSMGGSLGRSEFMPWFSDNWIIIAILLIAIGLIVDSAVRIIRARPHLLDLKPEHKPGGQRLTQQLMRESTPDERSKYAGYRRALGLDDSDAPGGEYYRGRNVRSNSAHNPAPQPQKRSHNASRPNSSPRTAQTNTAYSRSTQSAGQGRCRSAAPKPGAPAAKRAPVKAAAGNARAELTAANARATYPVPKLPSLESAPVGETPVQQYGVEKTPEGYIVEPQYIANGAEYYNAQTVAPDSAPGDMSQWYYPGNMPMQPQYGQTQPTDDPIQWPYAAQPIHEFVQQPGTMPQGAYAAEAGDFGLPQYMEAAASELNYVNQPEPDYAGYIANISEPEATPELEAAVQQPELYEQTDADAQADAAAITPADSAPRIAAEPQVQYSNAAEPNPPGLPRQRSQRSAPDSFAENKLAHSVAQFNMAAHTAGAWGDMPQSRRNGRIIATLQQDATATAELDGINATFEPRPRRRDKRNAEPDTVSISVKAVGAAEQADIKLPSGESHTARTSKPVNYKRIGAAPGSAPSTRKHSDVIRDGRSVWARPGPDD